MSNITDKELESKKMKLEIEKLQRENEKLEIEKTKLLWEQKEVQKSWYKKPQWWSVIVPFMLGIGTIWIAFNTGIFGIQKLEKQKEFLESTIKAQKDSLAAVSASFQEIQKQNLNARIQYSKIQDSIMNFWAEANGKSLKAR